VVLSASRSPTPIGSQPGGVSMYSDALREVDLGGQRMPLAALLARVQVTQQTRDLDKPLPPLDEWKAPPPGQPL
jgi:hypothetical protein